jgi:hypothetical protein
MLLLRSAPWTPREGRGRAKTARAAEALEVLSIEERRLTAFRNDTNIIRITAPEWRAWLRLARGLGKVQNHAAHAYKFIFSCSSAAFISA